MLKTLTDRKSKDARSKWTSFVTINIRNTRESVLHTIFPYFAVCDGKNVLPYYVILRTQSSGFVHLQLCFAILVRSDAADGLLYRSAHSHWLSRGFVQSDRHSTQVNLTSSPRHRTTARVPARADIHRISPWPSVRGQSLTLSPRSLPPPLPRFCLS